jgi:hypothetical protein
MEELGAFKGIEFTRNKAMVVVHGQNIAPQKDPGLLYTVKFLRRLYRPWAKIAGGESTVKVRSGCRLGQGSSLRGVAAVVPERQTFSRI